MGKAVTLSALKSYFLFGFVGFSCDKQHKLTEEEALKENVRGIGSETSRSFWFRNKDHENGTGMVGERPAGQIVV
jgi:hypothetical protein